MIDIDFPQGILLTPEELSMDLEPVKWKLYLCEGTLTYTQQAPDTEEEMYSTLIYEFCRDEALDIADGLIRLGETIKEQL